MNKQNLAEHRGEIPGTAGCNNDKIMSISVSVDEIKLATAHEVTNNHGSFIFDTGIHMNMLQEIYLIALDVFQNIDFHKKKSDLIGWLSFLTKENLADAEKLIIEYPWLEEIYREIASYRTNPEEALYMFRDSLLKADRNTMQYMIDEQKKEFEENQKVIEAQDIIILEKDKEIERLRKLLESQDI